MQSRTENVMLNPLATIYNYCQHLNFFTGIFSQPTSGQNLGSNEIYKYLFSEKLIFRKRNREE